MRLQGVSATVPGRTLFHDVTMDLGRGEIITLTGPSGCGKTTLLRIITGLQPFTTGTIQVGPWCLQAGQPVPHGLMGRVGLVFQDQQLFPHLDVLRNITLAPLVVQKRDRRQAEAMAHDRLAQVGLAGCATRRIGTLSGGERQRVAIARALAMNPDALLLDEPVSALDPSAVAGMADLLRRLAETHLPMLVVSHQAAFAHALGGRVLALTPAGLAPA